MHNQLAEDLVCHKWANTGNWIIKEPIVNAYNFELTRQIFIKEVPFTQHVIFNPTNKKIGSFIPTHNSTLVIPLEVPLFDGAEETILKILKAARESQCPRCKGSGIESIDYSRGRRENMCKKCNGTGLRRLKQIKSTMYAWIDDYV